MICEKCGHNDGKKMGTVQQRKAFFGIAVQRMADHYNVEKEIMYKALAGAFYGFEEIMIGPLTLKVPSTTRGRTTTEMNDFYAWIQRTAAAENIDIPSPNEPPRNGEH